MHSNGIWNDLELQWTSWKHCLCSMRSDSIQNDSELQTNMKTLSLKHAFRHYLKRFGTAANTILTFVLFHP